MVKEFREFLNRINVSANDLERTLVRYSDFGYTPRPKLKQTLQNIDPSISPILVENVLNMVDVQADGLVCVSHITDYLRMVEIYDGLN